jgi:NAD(P)-dependent dehydrogenase (short-subunit alcohol dehydrogenase family)
MKKKYLLIGGSSGIGEQVFTDMKVDSNLITISRSALSGSSMHFTCDILNDPLPEIEDPLDGLVYFPGSLNLKPFRALTESDFIADFEINVLGAVRIIKQYLKNLRQSGIASVVLFSTVAVSKGMSFHSSVSTAKAAVEGLTRSLAAEFAPKVRFNAIAPSLTNTPLASRILKNEQSIKTSVDRHPMKRIGEVNDISNAVAFLLSEKSSWITGQILNVDDGLSTLS